MSSHKFGVTGDRRERDYAGKRVFTRREHFKISREELLYWEAQDTWKVKAKMRELENKRQDWSGLQTELYRKLSVILAEREKADDVSWREEHAPETLTRDRRGEG